MRYKKALRRQPRSARRKGQVPVPPRERIIALLDKLPENLKAAKEHALLASKVAGKIAEQLKAKGIKINPEVAASMALSHAIFRHRGAMDGRYAQRYLAAHGFPQVGRGVIYSRRLTKEAMPHLSIEEMVYSYSDLVSRWEKVGNAWQHGVFSVDEAYKGVIELAKKGEIPDSLEFVLEEMGLIHVIENALVKKGMDLSAIRKIVLTAEDLK